MLLLGMGGKENMDAWICRDKDNLQDGFIDMHHRPEWKDETQTWNPGNDGWCETVASVYADQLDALGVKPGKCFRIKITLLPNKVLSR